MGSVPEPPEGSMLISDICSPEPRPYVSVFKPHSLTLFVQRLVLPVVSRTGSQGSSWGNHLGSFKVQKAERVAGGICMHGILNMEDFGGGAEKNYLDRRCDEDEHVFHQDGGIQRVGRGSQSQPRPAAPHCRDIMDMEMVKSRRGE